MSISTVSGVFCDLKQEKNHSGYIVSVHLDNEPEPRLFRIYNDDLAFKQLTQPTSIIVFFVYVPV
jgi:hypothetical protein